MDFETMFNEIKDFHIALGYDYEKKHKGDLTLKKKKEQMAALRDIALALNQEVAELLDSFPWKPWRSLHNQTYDLENAKEEVVDILFFLVEFCECVGISHKDIIDTFNYKLNENYNRINTGYNNTVEERR